MRNCVRIFGPILDKKVKRLLRYVMRRIKLKDKSIKKTNACMRLSQSIYTSRKTDTSQTDIKALLSEKPISVNQQQPKRPNKRSRDRTPKSFMKKRMKSSSKKVKELRFSKRNRVSALSKGKAPGPKPPEAKAENSETADDLKKRSKSSLGSKRTPMTTRKTNIGRKRRLSSSKKFSQNSGRKLVPCVDAEDKKRSNSRSPLIGSKSSQQLSKKVRRLPESRRSGYTPARLSHNKSEKGVSNQEKRTGPFRVQKNEESRFKGNSHLLTSLIKDEEAEPEFISTSIRKLTNHSKFHF